MTGRFSRFRLQTSTISEARVTKSGTLSGVSFGGRFGSKTVYIQEAGRPPGSVDETAKLQNTPLLSPSAHLLKEAVDNWWWALVDRTTGKVPSYKLLWISAKTVGLMGHKFPFGPMGVFQPDVDLNKHYTYEQVSSFLSVVANSIMPEPQSVAKAAAFLTTAFTTMRERIPLMRRRKAIYCKAQMASELSMMLSKDYPFYWLNRLIDEMFAWGQAPAGALSKAAAEQAEDAVTTIEGIQNVRSQTEIIPVPSPPSGAKPESRSIPRPVSPARRVSFHIPDEFEDAEAVIGNKTPSLESIEIGPPSSSEKTEESRPSAPPFPRPCFGGNDGRPSLSTDTRPPSRQHTFRSIGEVLSQQPVAVEAPGLSPTNQLDGVLGSSKPASILRKGILRFRRGVTSPQIARTNAESASLEVSMSLPVVLTEPPPDLSRIPTKPNSGWTPRQADQGDKEEEKKATVLLASGHQMQIPNVSSETLLELLDQADPRATPTSSRHAHHDQMGRSASLHSVATMDSSITAIPNIVISPPMIALNGRKHKNGSNVPSLAPVL